MRNQRVKFVKLVEDTIAGATAEMLGRAKGKRCSVVSFSTTSSPDALRSDHSAPAVLTNPKPAASAPVLPPITEDAGRPKSFPQYTRKDGKSRASTLAEFLDGVD